MKWTLLRLGTAPGVSTLYLPDVTTRDQTPQAFPLCICIQQAIKDWMCRRPGNEAGQIRGTAAEASQATRVYLVL